MSFVPGFVPAGLPFRGLGFQSSTKKPLREGFAMCEVLVPCVRRPTLSLKHYLVAISGPVEQMVSHQLCAEG